MLIIEEKIERKGNYPEKPLEVRKEEEKISTCKVSTFVMLLVSKYVFSLRTDLVFHRLGGGGKAFAV